MQPSTLPARHSLGDGGNPQPSTELAAIYRRVSTDKQDDSLELQERRTLDYARMKGLAVDDTRTFSDPDTSGSIPITERAGGRLLINLIKSGGIKHLIVSKLDRLGRNLRDGIEFLDLCKNNNVVVHIVDLGGDSISTQGHMGRMILNMLLNVAEWERAEICDRTSKQMQSLFDQYKLTGNVPYGWDCTYEFADGTQLIKTQSIPATELAGLEQLHGRAVKRLMDNTAEQAVIFWMAQAVRNKCKREHVALDLNKRGLKTKLGRAWQIGHVTSVLNSRYTRRLLEQKTL
jgi:DNA invertase Pin-like site-specific DNA recombinase